MLKIENLHVQIDKKPILRGLTLEIRAGEIHALMGPNGAGKSTLAKVIAAHPDYEVTAGHIYFEGNDILELEPEQRAHLGLFLSFQYPTEIPGVSNKDFLFQSLNTQRKARGEKAVTSDEFDQLAKKHLEKLQMNPEFLSRSINEGFSGGEKKRNEILQMNLFNPLLAVLDETDSGLDIDSMKIVAEGINKHFSNEKAILLITHYQRLLDYVQPHYVHVILGGKIVHSGGAELAHELEEKGYDWLMEKASA